MGRGEKETLKGVLDASEVTFLSRCFSSTQWNGRSFLTRCWKWMVQLWILVRKGLRGAWAAKYQETTFWTIRSIVHNLLERRLLFQQTKGLATGCWINSFNSSKSKGLFSPLGNNGSSQSGSNLARALEPATSTCSSPMWFCCRTIFFPAAWQSLLSKQSLLRGYPSRLTTSSGTSRHRLVHGVAQEHATVNSHSNDGWSDDDQWCHLHEGTLKPSMWSVGCA